MIRPVLRWVALYALVELVAVALLIWAVGVGWALVVLAATFIVGVVLAATQVKGQVGRGRLLLRQARRDPSGAVADGVLVGLGSGLVLLPGIVSTAVGALMLAPPTRSAMRPLASAMLSRGVARRVGVVDIDRYLGQFTGQFTGVGGSRGDYIDGEVVSEPPARRPISRTAIARRGI